MVLNINLVLKEIEAEEMKKSAEQRIVEKRLRQKQREVEKAIRDLSFIL